jgi:hypothetical protein
MNLSPVDYALLEALEQFRLLTIAQGERLGIANYSCGTLPGPAHGQAVAQDRTAIPHGGTLGVLSVTQRRPRIGPVAW